MSISLIAIVAALPIALTARVVMGEQKFNEWVESDQLILSTNFSSMDVFSSAVKGFDWYSERYFCGLHGMEWGRTSTVSAPKNNAIAVR